jgi:hypothetical protein
MPKLPAVFILSLALAGCAATPSMQAFKDSAAPHYAWDGAGEDPNQPKPARPSRTAAASNRTSALASVRAADTPKDEFDDAEDAEQQRRLSRALAICKGCLHPQPSDERVAGLSE